MIEQIDIYMLKTGTPAANSVSNGGEAVFIFKLIVLYTLYVILIL